MRHRKLAAHAVARIVQRWRKGCDSQLAGRHGEHTAANTALGRQAHLVGPVAGCARVNTLEIDSRANAKPESPAVNSALSTVITAIPNNCEGTFAK
jgi:hypothetical protein